MTDTTPTDLRQRPSACPTCDGENIWLLVYEDQDMEPVLFSGHGADEAAQKAFEHAATKWTVRLFKCVAQDGYGPGTSQRPALPDIETRIPTAAEVDERTGNVSSREYRGGFNDCRLVFAQPTIDRLHSALTAALRRIAAFDQQPARPGSGEVCLCHLKSCGVCRYKTDVDKATELRDHIHGLHNQLTAAQQRIAAFDQQPRSERNGRCIGARRRDVRLWMRHNAGSYSTATELAEAADDIFRLPDGGLDNETHWIWDEAVEAINDAQWRNRYEHR